MQPRASGPFPFTPITERPRQSLPGGAHVAVWVIVNMEVFHLDQPIPGGRPVVPDVRNYSIRDYGGRVGFFRLAHLLDRLGIPVTAALNSDVCDVQPQVVSEAMRLGWEFMGHCRTNSRLLNDMPVDEERDVIRQTMARIDAFTGKRPRGWLGTGLAESWHTLDFLAEEGIDYVCDWPNDDQPYLMQAGNRKLVSLPYGGEINDMPKIHIDKHTAQEFGQMIRDHFEVVHAEGAESARVMGIALHPFIIGAPHRIGALEAALRHIQTFDKVWFAQGSEIVDHYLASGATF